MRIRTLLCTLVAGSLLHSAPGAALGLGPAPTRARPLFPQLGRLRNSVTEHIFGRQRHDDVAAAAPRKTHAHELVLRFNLTAAFDDEAAALVDAARRLFLDVWSYSYDSVDLRLHRDDIAPLLSLLPASLQTAHSTLIANISSAILDSTTACPLPKAHRRTGSLAGLLRIGDSGDDLFFQDYQPLPVITQWMRLLETMFPAMAHIVTIGKSYEGRDILALRVQSPVAPPNSAGHPRRTIVVMGGMHAREWISTTSTNFAAWTFITSFGKEPLITRLLEELSFVFIPTINPDGVEYSWHVDRLWRKSRQPTSLRFCAGFDMDHAFSYGWDDPASRHSPCSESYGGEEPFQAVEAMQLAEWARNETAHNNVRFVGLLDLHSYSQQVLYPYAHSCQQEPPNLENLQELAVGLAKALKLSNGEFYTVSPACEGVTLYENATQSARFEPGGGSVIDWFYHEMKTRYSFQIKLRDTGSYGFLLPRELIVPTGIEATSAVKYLGDYLLGNNGIEKGVTRGRRPESVPLNDVVTANQDILRWVPRH